MLARVLHTHESTVDAYLPEEARPDPVCLDEVCSVVRFSLAFHQGLQSRTTPVDIAPIESATATPFQRGIYFSRVVTSHGTSDMAACPGAQKGRNDATTLP